MKARVKLLSLILALTLILTACTESVPADESARNSKADSEQEAVHEPEQEAPAIQFEGEDIETDYFSIRLKDGWELREMLDYFYAKYNNNIHANFAIDVTPIDEALRWFYGVGDIPDNSNSDILELIINSAINESMGAIELISRKTVEIDNTHAIKIVFAEKYDEFDSDIIGYRHQQWLYIQYIIFNRRQQPRPRL